MREQTSLLSLVINRRPVYWGGLAVASLLILSFAKLSIDNFRYLQAQNIGGLSVFNEVVLPLAGLTLFVQIIFTLFTTSILFPAFHQLGQFSILIQSNLSVKHWLVFSLTVLLRLSFWPLAIFSIAVVWLEFHTALDWMRLITTVCGITLIWIISGLIFLSISLFSTSPLKAFLTGLLVIGFILFVDTLFRVWWPLQIWRGLFTPFLLLRQGLLSLSDLVSYIVWLAFSSWAFLTAFSKLKFHQSGKAYFFLPAFIIALLLSSLVPGSFDLSIDQRNQISEEITQRLKGEKKQLLVTAVINDETSKEEIMRGLSLIQAQVSTAQIRFESRQSLGPDMRHAGEFIQFSLGNASQAIAYPFEQDVKSVFEEALDILLSRKQQVITFIEGHGEASPFGKTTSDIKQFYKLLKDSGWQVVVQNLTQHRLNDATDLLVIASSKQSWLPGEAAQVINYLKSGKNILLLMDPESEIPESISQFLGIQKAPGTLVDWRGYQSGTPHPAVLVIDKFEKHPVVAHLNQLLAFPWASGIEKASSFNEQRFRFVPLLKTHKGVWNEHHITAESLSFDEEQGEKQQVFSIAVSLLGQKSQQKAIVVGDSHFLSDSAINNYDNLQFSLNLVSWLTGNSLNQQPQVQDAQLKPAKIGQFVFHWILLPGIPIAFLLLGYLRHRS